MNLANVLTVSRIFFAGLIAVLLLQQHFWAYVLATVFFTIAALTDYYDGYWARRKKLISDFGKIMDPIADKVLLLTLFGVFAVMGLMAWWMLIVIALREVLVTVDRLILMKAGKVLAAEKAGKVKTVLQIVAVSLLLIYLMTQFNWLMLPIQILLWMVVLITVFSGLMYLRSR